MCPLCLQVRILLSFFPPGLLPLFKRFLAPALNGRLGPYLSAKVTLVTCQWLMGPSKASEIQLADGSFLDSGVSHSCALSPQTSSVLFPLSHLFDAPQAGDT